MTVLKSWWKRVNKKRGEAIVDSDEKLKLLSAEKPVEGDRHTIPFEPRNPGTKRSMVTK